MTAPRPLRWPSLIILALLLATLACPSAQAAAPVQQGCFDIVVDGGFEQRNWWTLGGGLLPAAYVSSPTFSGSSAMQLGNQVNATSIEAYSTVRQTLTIPTNAVSAQLTFWVWTATEANPGLDRQEALLLTPGASVLSVSPGAVWSDLSNSGSYRQIAIDVIGQRGRTFDLAFSVYNDGAGGRTWMTVDEVRLVICLAAPGPTATPTFAPFPTATPTFVPFPTATPTFVPSPGTPSPIPPDCVDILTNGDFEWDGAWLFGDTTIPPFYAGAPHPVFSGSRSMALGAVLPSAPANVPAFSSIQQSITLPTTAQTARIRFQVLPSSNASPGGLNRQELVLLDPLNFSETIDVPWRVTLNSSQWQLVDIDLTRFLGRTVTVYFNARNAGDGTRTSMFLDQVQVLVCDTLAIMPFSGASAPAPIQAPMAAPVPAQPLPIAQNTIIAVNGGAAPLPEVTPGPMVTPTTTPDLRGNQGSIIDLSALNNPWLIIIVISALILLCVIAALYYFRGGSQEKPPS
jgi:hypothetical protein